MKQYKQRNFYTHEIVNNLELLYSYDTLVGVRYFDKVFFTVKKMKMEYLSQALEKYSQMKIN